MADYRDLAAALGGGYGQDTGGITPDTLITLKNGKTASAGDLLGMLKGFGQAIGSNLESLGRGGVASVIGAGGDLESLGRMGINKLYGAGGVNVSPNPVLPTTTDILGMIPRATAPRQETAGMEELGGYMTPATAKVLTPAIKGAARLAGQEINAGLTGQPTRSLLGTITPKPKLLDVYHGTPHTLPPTERNPLGEFDASKIGSGEGAQAYGYGIYTAEAPIVAKEYQQKLSSTGSAKNLVNQFGSVDGGLAEAERRVEHYKQLIADGGGGAMERAKSFLKIAEKNVEDLKTMKAGLPENKGNLYKVDLPDKMIPKMLDYDKPMSEQSLEVQKILLPYQKEIGGSFGTGEQTLKAIAFERRMKGLDDSPQAVADQLQKMGIVGVKYFDAQSRPMPNITNKRLADLYQKNQGNAEATVDEFMRSVYNTPKKKAEMRKQFLKELETPKTRNFVVFPGEEKNMTILERNAEKITK